MAKRIALLGLLLLLVTAHSAEPRHYEVRTRTAADPEAADVVQADSAAAARDIVAGRHPDGQILGVREVTSAAGREWYQARLSVDGVNVTDSVLATGSGEARRMLTSRFPAGRIVSLTATPPALEQRLYEGTVYGAGKKAFKDGVLASGTSDARKTLQARYPGARIGSLTEILGTPSTTAERDAQRQAEDGSERAREEAKAAKARVQKARHEEYRAVVEAGQEALAQKKVARQEWREAEQAAKAASRAGAITATAAAKRIREARQEADAAMKAADREARAKKAAARQATKAAAK